MAWEYRNVLIGGQVKFAGGRWSCEALRDRRGQRVAIRYQEEVKSNLDRGDLTGLHELYYPEVWTAETQIDRRQKLGMLQVVAEKSQAPAPVPILTETAECIETNAVAETDLDADLLMRLQQAGYK